MPRRREKTAGGPDGVEQAPPRLRSSTPGRGLRAREQSGAAAGVEVGGDFVEQQDRRRRPALSDQLGMGEDDGRAAAPSARRSSSARRADLGHMGDGEVLAVRADGGAAGGASRPRLARSVAARSLSSSRRAQSRRAGNRRRRVAQASAARRRCARAHRAIGAMLGHPASSAAAIRVGAIGLGEQFVACAHRRFVARGVRRGRVPALASAGRGSGGDPRRCRRTSGPSLGSATAPTSHSDSAVDRRPRRH